MKNKNSSVSNFQHFTLRLLPLPPLYFNFSFFFEMRVHGILILIAFPLWFTLTPSTSPSSARPPFYSWSFQSSNIRLEGKCDINTFSCSLPPSLLHSIMDVEPFFPLWLDKNTITIHTCTRTTTPMMMCITYGIEKVYISSGTRKPNLNEVKIDNETHHFPFVKGS